MSGALLGLSCSAPGRGSPESLLWSQSARGSEQQEARFFKSLGARCVLAGALEARLCVGLLGILTTACPGLPTGVLLCLVTTGPWGTWESAECVHNADGAAGRASAPAAEANYLWQLESGHGVVPVPRDSQTPPGQRLGCGRAEECSVEPQ